MHLSLGFYSYQYHFIFLKYSMLLCMVKEATGDRSNTLAELLIAVKLATQTGYKSFAYETSLSYLERT